MTSAAIARASYSSESHSSVEAWILNHLTQTSRQYSTHALYSSPPALLAVSTTAFVMTVLFALVMDASSSSNGMTRSIWYFNRSATLVTSFAGSAGAIVSPRYVGRTVFCQ